jgi:RNA 2',3'-cyclic 3'-phosphodiesterase
MRLFFAFDLPDAAKAHLDEAVAPLRSSLPAARWVRPEIFHLTLAFLGEVAADLVPALSHSLRERLEQEGGFRTHFGVLGAFPNAGPLRVLWVGLEPSARFVHLAESVEDGLRSARVPFDDKPFRSHVTLARCDPPWPASHRADLAGGVGERLAGHSFVCDRVKLFSSVLGSGGPTYRTEVEIPLLSA